MILRSILFQTRRFLEHIKPVPDPHKVLWFGEKASRGHLFVHLELKKFVGSVLVNFGVSPNDYNVWPGRYWQMPVCSFFGPYR